MVEPVMFTAIRPKLGPRATGVGDIETTLTYLVKIPTAGNRLIGTGRTDFAGYFIASKRFGNVDTHADLGYTIIGKPLGVRLRNIANFALAFQYHPGGGATELYGEMLGNTASAPTGTAENTPTPEVSGGELVGTLGVGHSLSRVVFGSFGVSYDNNGAIVLRPGFIFRFR